MNAAHPKKKQKKTDQIIFRCTPETRRQLEKSAAANGRTLSQEVNFRMEHSFKDV